MLTIASSLGFALTLTSTLTALETDLDLEFSHLTPEFAFLLAITGLAPIAFTQRRQTHARPSGRVVVWIVVTVALTSIATGLLAILTQPTLEGTGPLADLQAVTEFSGTVIGFALLIAAWGMVRGYRLAYVSGAVLVFLSAAHGVAQSRLLSVPLVVLSIVGFVVLLFTSDRFTRSSSLTGTQLGTLVAIAGVFCYGTVGAYALRAEFDELTTVVDAVYFTLVTASTVGYGDIHPASEGARLFTVSLVLLGPTTVAVAVGSLIGPAVERRLTRAGQRVKTRNSHRARRILVLGFDEMTARCLEHLTPQATVTVVTDEEVSSELGNSDWMDSTADVDLISGDPTDESTLERVTHEIDTVLVATGDNDRNVNAVIAARAITDARIVALARNGIAHRLERVGADETIDPEQLLVDAVVGTTLGTDGG